jgi:hypothetical protein
MEFIIRWKPKHGIKRSEIEKNLAKEGWGTSLTPEEIDRCEFIERKIKDKYGSDKSHVRTTDIRKVK